MSAAILEIANHAVKPHGLTRILSDNIARTVLVLLIALATAYWLWFGLTQRSITGDDGISILAAQGILEHGYPRLPSGFIYYRGFVPAYLLAGSIWVFGLNDFAIILPSLIFSLGSLVLTYMFARDVLGRPLVGLLSVAILLTLDAQTLFATSPRMYISLQFFTILSAYSAWRGYINGRTLSRFMFFVGVVGAALSHQQGGALLVMIPAAILSSLWITGISKSCMRFIPDVGVLAALAALYLSQFVLELPAAAPIIAAHGGTNPGHTGLNSDIAIWLKHIFNLESTVPIALWFSPLILVLAYRSAKQINSFGNKANIYTILLFSGTLIATLLVVKSVGSRFWMMSLPFYVLLLCRGLSNLPQYLSESRIRLRFLSSNKQSFIFVGLTAWILAILLTVYLFYDLTDYARLIKSGYGYSCSGSEEPCSVTIKKQYQGLKSVIQEDDIVISSNPQVTNFYLGRADGYFRERKIDGSFSEFTSPTDEYFGIPLIDSKEEIDNLYLSDRRVWFLLHDNARLSVAKESIALLHEKFNKYDDGAAMVVYLNHLADPDTENSRMIP